MNNPNPNPSILGVCVKNFTGSTDSTYRTEMFSTVRNLLFASFGLHLLSLMPWFCSDSEAFPRSFADTVMSLLGCYTFIAVIHQTH